jgi:hypothetical protein
MLENVRKSSPDAFVTELLKHMRNPSSSAELRQFSAVMLRQCCSSHFEVVWTKLSPPLQTAVKTTLLELLRSDDSLRHKASSCVGQLATSIVKKGMLCCTNSPLY